MAVLPYRPRTLIRAALVLSGLWIVVQEVHVVAFGGASLGLLSARGTHLVVLLLASFATLARGALVRRERAAWLLLGAGSLAWALGEVYYTLHLWSMSNPPLPSPADAGYLLFPVCALAGMVALLRARAAVSAVLLVDGGAAALAVAALSAAIVLQTVLAHTQGDRLAVTTALAYPVTDLILLAVGVGATASTGWRIDSTWVLLAIGILTFWLADSLYLVHTADSTYQAGGWFDPGWWVGLLAIAFAAWREPPARRLPPREDSLRLIAAPLVAGAVGLELLLYASGGGLNPLAVGLAAASLVFVMIRLTVTFRQNVVMLRASRTEARTDALTGLANRRALEHELAARLADARDDAPLVLALFDLDGFKHYNDSFGHPAGDALLVRLGGNLSRFFDGRGDVFRMGGDEFCALFDPRGADLETLLDGAAMALSEQGDGFWIGCSFGAVTLPAEAAVPPDALRIADQRMYAAKHAGRVSATRQSVNVLLRALAERDPELRGRLHVVAELAEATARRLGLAPDEVDAVRHAAELHDVGKVSIPERILAKPGPLDAEEWEIVRRHTLAGERIVAAIPTLAGVARVVRYTHERWDGSGYPDALAGDVIPIGARVIAVCDAFEAMSAGRPYREAVSAVEAVAELRRCAGTQFDPAVVDAFCAAWAPVPVAA